MDQWARETILKIADRAHQLAVACGNKSFRPMDVVMALTFVHAEHPLRLKELFEADVANFAHDVFGILQHIDPNSGELDIVRFCPRFLVRS